MFARRQSAAIGHMGPEVVPTLAWLLRNEDTDQRDRVTAAAVLAEMGPMAGAAMPALQDLLTDKRPELQQAAINALGQLGPAAKTAIPNLRRLLDDKDKRVRIQAAEALVKIGPIGGEVALPALTDLLKDENKNIRIDAAGVLRQFGPEEKAAAVSTLIELSKDDNKDVRLHAVEALEKAGTEARAAIPLLRQLLGDPHVGQAAFRTLLRMGPADENDLPAIMELLKTSAGYARPYATVVLGRMEPDGKAAAIPLLADLLHDNDAMLRGAAAAALGEMGGGGRRPYRRWQSCCADKEPPVRQAAVNALIEIGSENQSDGSVEH